MKTVLITGAARGLGRHLSDAFLSAGYAAALNCFSSCTEAGLIARRYDESAVVLKADVGDMHQVSPMFKRIEQRFGRLDVIVNNAGITIDRLLLKQTEEEWDMVIRTNLTGCFNVVKAAVPLMIKSGGGHIINIVSYSGIKGSAGQAAYSASKAGLIGLTVSLAQELAEYNIRVNAVVPGYMPTEMGTSSVKAMAGAKQASLLHSLSDPPEVAGQIVAIAGLRHATGQIISLDSRII